MYLFVFGSNSKYLSLSIFDWWFQSVNIVLLLFNIVLESLLAVLYLYSISNPIISQLYPKLLCKNEIIGDSIAESFLSLASVTPRIRYLDWSNPITPLFAKLMLSTMLSNCFSKFNLSL